MYWHGNIQWTFFCMYNMRWWDDLLCCMGIFSLLQVLIMQMMAIATGWSEARLMPLVKEGKSSTPWMIVFPLKLSGKKNKLWLWLVDRQFKRPLISVLKTAILSGPLLLCGGLSIYCTMISNYIWCYSSSKSNNIDQNMIMIWLKAEPLKCLM